MQNFFKLQCLVDDLAELDVGLGNEKKSILLQNNYILFFKKLLLMT